MLIYNQLEACAISAAQLRDRIRELIEDPEWDQLVESLANDQAPDVRPHAHTSLHVGAIHHRNAARQASYDFRLLADLYLQKTLQSSAKANTTPASHQPIIPHRGP
jgi:hypothetical protein